MASDGSVPPPTGPVDPAIGLQRLTELLQGNQLGPTLALLQQYGGLLSGGILEYIRQMSINNQPSSSTQCDSQPNQGNGLQSLENFNATIQTSTANGKYAVTIPLGKDVKPEDVKVAIKDRDLVVDVKVESKAEDGSSRLYQELTKKVRLPDEVKVNEVKTVLSPEGILNVEAPLPQAGSVRPQMVEIPVNMDLD
jgi:HSP20 family molecular chaperone IbpA